MIHRLHGWWQQIVKTLWISNVLDSSLPFADWNTLQCCLSKSIKSRPNNALMLNKDIGSSTDCENLSHYDDWHNRGILPFCQTRIDQKPENWKLKQTEKENRKLITKHHKNCECCPVSLLIVRSQRLSWIQVLNCQNCSQCLKTHKSLGSLFEGAL